MDALKDALKKALVELQSEGMGHHVMAAPGAQSASADMHASDPMNSDKAPSIKGPQMMGDQDGDDVQMQALKGIADKAHTGRGSMGLGERAADGAKAKMASIQKHKKK